MLAWRSVGGLTEELEPRGRSYSDLWVSPSKLAKDGTGGLGRGECAIAGDVDPRPGSHLEGMFWEQMVDQSFPNT